jgi:hypothetical protein
MHREKSQVYPYKGYYKMQNAIELIIGAPRYFPESVVKTRKKSERYAH